MPSQLFENVVKHAHNNPNLNTDLKAIFTAIESSAVGYDSEQDIKGLFADFDTTSNRLGNTVEDKNKRLGDGDPTLINDERFAPTGVLAPKSKADFAFILHALSYLSARGRAAIVTFPGIFYRGGAEQKIRQYLVENNFVETVISLAPNLFLAPALR